MFALSVPLFTFFLDLDLLVSPLCSLLYWFSPSTLVCPIFGMKRFWMVGVLYLYSLLSRKLMNRKSAKPHPVFVFRALLNADWNTLIVGKLSPWIRPDSKVEKIRRNSEAV